MSENKGQYVFNTELLDKRIRDLRETEPTSKDFLVRMIELTDEMAALAGAAILTAPQLKVSYTDEEVREMVRHLNAVIKAYHNDNCHGLPAAQVRDAEGFLRSKKYFNLNQSDLV